MPLMYLALLMSLAKLPFLSREIHFHPGVILPLYDGTAISLR